MRKSLGGKRKIQEKVAESAKVYDKLEIFEEKLKKFYEIDAFNTILDKIVIIQKELNENFKLKKELNITIPKEEALLIVKDLLLTTNLEEKIRPKW